VVAHYSGTGTLLGTWNSGVNPSQGLALDPADGTLWMGDSSYVLHQFDQSGNNLQNVSFNSVAAGGWYGMEFDTLVVPEPSSAVLAGLALVGLVTVTRRRR